jgi:uncharacterized protein with FMN-binding domain
MRTTAIAVIGASSLAVPTIASWISVAQAATTKRTATRTFAGSPGNAGRWGHVDVIIVVRRTTTTNPSTKKKTVARRITAVRVPVSPNHTNRSIFINRNALPVLIQETIKAQRSSIDFVSGASDTSQGFEQSLQSAILRARAW